MKFSNGCWLNKKGTEVFSPAEVYFVKDDQILGETSGRFSCDEIVICAPTHAIRHRGPLSGVNLSIRISAPYPRYYE